MFNELRVWRALWGPSWSRKIAYFYFQEALKMVKISIWGTPMRNNTYKLNWYYEYIIFKKQIIQRSYPNIHLILIMFGHFKKSASILTDQDTQMVGNDQSLATICNAEFLFWLSIFGKNRKLLKIEISIWATLNSTLSYYMLYKNIKLSLKLKSFFKKKSIKK